MTTSSWSQTAANDGHSANLPRSNASTASISALGSFGPAGRGILQDMGYTVQNPVWASVVFVGFLFIRRKRAW